MSLKMNSQAPSFTAENTPGKIDFRQWVPEADAEGDLYGENGERMPYYPARPRQQGPYERSSQQIQIFKCPEGSNRRSWVCLTAAIPLRGRGCLCRVKTAIRN